MPKHDKLVSAITGAGAAPQQLMVQNYTVDHIDASGTATRDGTTAAYLAIAGTGANATQAAYAASYAPAAGDTVRVLLVNDSPFILGRVAGLPIV